MPSLWSQNLFRLTYWHVTRACIRHKITFSYLNTPLLPLESDNNVLLSVFFWHDIVELMTEMRHHYFTQRRIIANDTVAKRSTNNEIRDNQPWQDCHFLFQTFGVSFNEPGKRWEWFHFLFKSSFRQSKLIFLKKLLYFDIKWKEKETFAMYPELDNSLGKDFKHDEIKTNCTNFQHCSSAVIKWK